MQYLVFGTGVDSGLTASYGGWVTKLHEVVLKKVVSGKSEYEVLYNCSIASETSKATLDRFLPEAKARIDASEENVIIFSLGTNDAAFVHKDMQNWVSLDEYKRTMTLLIKQARSIRCKVIIVGLGIADDEKVAPCPWAPQFSYMEKHMRVYDRALQDICKKEDIPYVDIATRLSPKMLFDGLHPNDKGHDVMFAAVKETLEKNKWL